MSVWQRNGIWYADARVGNVRIKRSVGPAGTRQEAQELETALRKQLQDDRHSKRLNRSLSRSFGDALVQYLKSEEVKALRSYDNLRDKARALRPFLEHVRLEDIPEAAEKMKQTLLAQGLKAATINSRLAIVRRILNLSYRNWKWLRAPLYITLLTVHNERHIYPDSDLVERLALACPDPEVGDFVRLAYYTGLRKSELFRVNANPSRYIIDGRIVLDAQTKTSRPGVVPIAVQVSSIIPRLPLKISDNQVRVNFEAARLSVGRPELHFHDLRHGFASLLAEAGADFLDIMKLMRHTSPQSTKRYTHLLDSRLRAIVDGIGRSQIGPTKKRSGDG